MFSLKCHMMTLSLKVIEANNVIYKLLVFSLSTYSIFTSKLHIYRFCIECLCILVLFSMEHQEHLYFGLNFLGYLAALTLIINKQAKIVQLWM